MSNSIIQISDLMKIYQMGTQEVRALNGVSFDVEENEYIAIMGPSGSGKSTLMNLIGCLDTPTSGTYILNNQDVLLSTILPSCSPMNRQETWIPKPVMKS